MKHLFIGIFLLFAGWAAAQQPFSYVIIPTQFPELGKGFNPYGVSSVLQKVLNEKGIKTVFEADQRPADYCDAANVVLEKTSSMFTNKLKVELRDCQNNIVWSREGVGRSKDFAEGYAEALEDALQDLNALPPNTLVQRVPAVSGPVAAPVAQPEPPAVAQAPAAVPSSEAEDTYKPRNLFFNETYFVDLVNEEGNVKKLLIINGKLLGYSKLQNIATLTPADVPGMFTAEWITPKGEILRGVASLGEDKLTVSLSSDGKPFVITLMKQ